MIQDLAGGDLHHASCEICGWWELIRLVPRDEIGLLHDILGLLAIARQRKRISAQSALGARQELNELSG